MVRFRQATGSILLLALTAALGADASAYSGNTVHPVLADAAVRLFNECVRADEDRSYSKQGWRLSPDQRALIVAADGAEDQPALERALNWHFHHRNSDAPSLLMHGVERSLDRIVGEITEAIGQHRIGDTGLYPLLGRVLHYIEDMTVPAHVVPVYHGALQKDWVDEYPVAGEPPGVPLRLNLAGPVQVLCEALADPREYSDEGDGSFAGVEGTQASLVAVVSATANGTLAAIEEIIKPGCELTWSMFWTPPSGEVFFGSYLEPLPARCELTESGTRRCVLEPYVLSAGAQSCTVESADFDHFVAGLHRRAVLAGTRALFNAMRRIDP